jgi:predicted Holliday junction resolvase-like endonuclease
MFELYGIFDKSELIILFLSFVIFVLLIVIFFILVLPKAEKEIVSIEKEIMNDDVKDKIEDKKDSEEIKKKYEKLLEEKEIKNNEMIKYSPSEFATLLKYNPILPYSAFTMDIINNAYLDFNEQSNFDDRYFSLNNYDNIYRSYNEPVSDNEDTIKMKNLKEKIDRHKNSVDKFMSSKDTVADTDSKTSTDPNNSNSDELNEDYKNNNAY